jgi:hypothetical protein
MDDIEAQRPAAERASNKLQQAALQQDANPVKPGVDNGQQFKKIEDNDPSVQEGWRAAYDELKRRDEQMVKDYKDEIDTLLVFVRPVILPPHAIHDSSCSTRRVFSLPFSQLSSLNPTNHSK